MTAVHLVIIGGGPLCAYAVERLCAMSADRPAVAAGLRISIFDRTGRFGAGATHSDGQCATSHMNRVASQIAFAADESNEPASALLPRAMRPTFFEWVSEKFAATGDARFLLRPADIPPRRLHGEALREQFALYVSMLRGGGVQVDLYACEATDIAPEGDVLSVRGSALAEPLRADRVLLVTGHSRNHPAPGSTAARLEAHPYGRFIADAYPLEEQLSGKDVPPGCSAGILGMGLTAIDVLLHLTEGRGGSFVEGPDGLRYVPSGGEPAVLIPCAPSGMFPWCRPENEKAADGSGGAHAALEHKGVFLTIAAIEALRRRCGTGPLRQLDFECHVFPLIVLEMAYVYGRTLWGSAFAEAFESAAAPHHSAFLERGAATRNDGIALLSSAVTPLFDDRGHPFDWQALFDPLGTAGETARWQERVVDFMRRDHAAAAEGNLRNPVKAACDGVWRDLRSVLSAAVDFGGLTAASQRRFATVYLRHYTRMSNGIGLRVMTKVLALIESGIVDVSLGPAPVVDPIPGAPAFRMRGTYTGTVRDVDVMIEGRAHPFDVERDVFPLYPNLFARGLVRRWRNHGADGESDYEPGALDVTRDLHPIGVDGSVDRRITILGAPLEGIAYFQLTAARPRSGSAVLNQLARWANDLVATLEAAHADAVPAQAEACATQP